MPTEGPGSPAAALFGCTRHCRVDSWALHLHAALHSRPGARLLVTLQLQQGVRLALHLPPRAEMNSVDTNSIRTPLKCNQASFMHR